MNSQDIIHQLLYQSMLDIRYAAYEQKGFSGIFKLSDLFHNIPLKLNRIVNGDGTYDDLLGEIKSTAEAKGCESWLNNVMRQIDPSKER